MKITARVFVDGAVQSVARDVPVKIGTRVIGTATVYPDGMAELDIDDEDYEARVSTLAGGLSLSFDSESACNRFLSASHQRSLPIRSQALVPGMRVVLQEHANDRGRIVKVSRSGYVHVEWDDHSEGWFSPAQAAAVLLPATGDDALPRHVWIFDVPAREAPGWKESRAPLPSLEHPVCAVCREALTADNETGPCRK